MECLYIIYIDDDMIWASREILEKFIRELHRLTTYVNKLKTLTFIWYDEYGFLPFNDVIYMNAAPAFKTASMNAKAAHAPYGILITTTPGAPYGILPTIIFYYLMCIPTNNIMQIQQIFQYTDDRKIAIKRIK